MDKQFWLERWQQNQIGFHESQPSPILLRYLERFKLPVSPTTLVPLCGKSLDMLYLRQKGHHIIGVELSEKAINAFFEENNIPFNKTTRGSFHQYSGENITIFQGDFFQLTKDIIGQIDFIYDRAALIALPPAMREKYMQHMQQLVDNNVQMLLVTLNYPAGVEGPPFSVENEEVFESYSQWQTKELESIPTQNISDKFKDAGIESVSQNVIWLQKK